MISQEKADAITEVLAHGSQKNRIGTIGVILLSIALSLEKIEHKMEHR